MGHLDAKPGVEFAIQRIGAIAPRVRHDPSACHVVIHRRMDVTMNPEIGGAAETLHRAGIRGDQMRVFLGSISLWNRQQARRMVCHHHRRPMVIGLKFMLKPGSRLLVPILDFCRDEGFITRAFDALEVVDPPLCVHHGQGLVTAQSVICPQRTAQKPDAFQCDGIVFQHVDVGACCLFPRFVDCAVDIGVIPIVMVAQHQNHWPIRKSLLDPSNGLATTMDVTRQHHHIGSGGNGLPRLELDVQIGEMTWMVAMFFSQVVGADRLARPASEVG